MRITVLAVNNYQKDPRARVLMHQLTRAGHDVSLVRISHHGAGLDGDFEEILVAPDQPTGHSLRDRLARRLQTTTTRDALRSSALVRCVVESHPELIVPTTEAAVPVASEAASHASAYVARAPQWSSPGPRDLIDLAPAIPSASRPVRTGLPFHTPESHPEPYRPAPGRHAGTRLALAYRKTDSNPGKYLEAALMRAGVAVDLYTDAIDFDALAPDTNAVLFVEGPYPEIRVSGVTPPVPIGFWVHHGEHHLGANLRLADRYRADLILLAHSWHLAHFFRQPVQRFPFGMAPDLFDGSTPIADRRYDVAMVGAYIRGGGPYAFRGHLTTSLEAALPSTAFEEGVSASRMAELYEQARIIPNEGGTRHFPITMRVLEAIGAGALLVTEPIPGLDQILTPGEHFLHLDVGFVDQFQSLLADQVHMQRIVDQARSHVAGAHLYDHRVDELLAGLKAAEKVPPAPDQLASQDPLEALIDQDVEVQRVLSAPGTTLVLPGRELWENVGDPSPASYEAVAFRGTTPPDAILQAARRYIYAEAPDRPVLDSYLAAHQPQAEITESGTLIRIDLKAASYRATT
ncbi:MAG: glycosyltransferase [Acidimicrobiia bacterium]|nr:glycosyltransferase [Acidimicrobiia bacterium]MDH5504902.1 glycosyltransferase [Acidimicrobiia bacterium]